MKDKREGFPGCNGCKYDNGGNCAYTCRLGTEYYNGCREWHQWFAREWRAVRKAAQKLKKEAKHGSV